MKQVILKVCDGIVDPINIPDGIEVAIRDYDMANTVANELIHTDQNGDDFIEIVFEGSEV
jgi:hypothetical protein